MPTKQKEKKRPLSGIRVLDLSRNLAGPYGSMLLGDLGAEIIKIEPPEGDATRTFVGPSYKGESFYFLAFNRNKRSVVLDVGTPLGKEAFYDLVKISDVVWDNFRPGAMKRLGADYETLKKLNPKIICCSITGYGSSGPYRDRPSYDIIAQALSGAMSITGEPDGPPLKTGPPIGDMLGGMFAALGVVAALVRRAKTGRGCQVETSLLDSCISVLAYHFVSYFLSGVVPRRIGSAVPHTAPTGAYKTKDGYICIVGAWPRIARVVGQDWMIDEPKYSSQASRVEHKEELDRILSECFAQATNKQWDALFEVEDIPGAPVNTLDKVALDPQVIHNKMILTVEHPSGGEIKLTGNPIKVSDVEEEYSPPPPLGQHTLDVFCGLLGYSQERVDRMKIEEKEHSEELHKHLHKVQ